MSRLLQKYEDFLQELEFTVEPFQILGLKETFTNKECEEIVVASTAATILRSQEELNKECIREVQAMAERFKLEEGE